MEMTITHCRYAPKWETLNTLLREATPQDGMLVRISRRNRGVDYRAPGVYDLGFLQENGTVLPITLTVQAVGE